MITKTTEDIIAAICPVVNSGTTKIIIKSELLHNFYVYLPLLCLLQEFVCCILGSQVTDADKINLFSNTPLLNFVEYGMISTVYVSPGCTPYSVTLVLLTIKGDWSELTLCVTT